MAIGHSPRSLLRLPAGALAPYRRLLPLLAPHRRRLAAVACAAAAGPLLVASRIWLLKTLIDTVLAGHRPDLLPAVAAAFVVIAAVRGALASWVQAVTGRIGTEVVATLRTRTYDHLHGMSLRWFHGQSLGDLLTRLSADISAIEDVLVSGVATVVSNVVTLGLFLGLLIYLDAGLLALAAVVIPALVVLSAVEARLSRRAQREIREASSALTTTAEQGLSAVALVKAFARRGYEGAQYAAATRRSASARLRAVRIGAAGPAGSDVLVATGTAIVVGVGAGQVLAGTLTLGSLIVFISYLASLFAPIQALGRLTGRSARALVGAERVLEILDTPAELRERSGSPALPPVRGVVEFRGVTFGYTEQRPVLRGIDLRVEPGETVAVIGVSGAGKTTMVSLLLGYYDVEDGQVCLDGHPLRRHDPDSAREQIAAVLQEPMLFDTTIADNIRYGRLDASDGEVVAAATAACADEFIRELPLGYDTPVGRRGALLSGGQRQRLAIARALVKAAPVLLLDEATSALDPATEARVLAGIRRASPDAAVLIIAHRHTTVAHADRVAVLHGGRIVELGTPAELAVRGPVYREFLQGQRPDLVGVAAAAPLAGSAGLPCRESVRRADSATPVERAYRR